MTMRMRGEKQHITQTQKQDKMTNTWNNKLCRACLTSSECFSYILSENVPSEMYCFCTSIQIKQDNLPKTLCNECYELLTKYSDFKKTCLQSENALLTSTFGVTHRLPETLYKESNKTESHQEDFQDPVKVKSEEDQFYDDLLTVKEEDMSDHFANELFEEVHPCNDNITTTRSNHVRKKRKSKKNPKLKPQRKLTVKLKITKKHFSFSCDICNKKFNYQERFEAHKLEHEGKVAIIHCLPCNKTFMTWSGLRRHNENEHTHISSEKLKCSICGKICKSQQTLKMHQYTHGERKIYVCDVCGKGCTTKFILKAHLETHKENRERLFTCEHCGKKFYSNTILLSHVSKRHTGRRFVCQICSYPFTDKYNLAKHVIVIHDGKKLYKCEICNKSYGNQSTLVEHRRIHSGERPYLCSSCPKSFLSKRRLDDHRRVHSGERPHRCAVCDQGFTQRGTLKRHMKIHDRTMPVVS